MVAWSRFCLPKALALQEKWKLACSPHPTPHFLGVPHARLVVRRPSQIWVFDP